MTSRQETTLDQLQASQHPYTLRGNTMTVDARGTRATLTGSLHESHREVDEAISVVSGVSTQR